MPVLKSFTIPQACERGRLSTTEAASNSRGTAVYIPVRAHAWNSVAVQLDRRFKRDVKTRHQR